MYLKDKIAILECLIKTNNSIYNLNDRSLETIFELPHYSTEHSTINYNPSKPYLQDNKVQSIITNPPIKQVSHERDTDVTNSVTNSVTNASKKVFQLIL